jgi:hypothetical protein
VRTAEMVLIFFFLLYWERINNLPTALVVLEEYLLKIE